MPSIIFDDFKGGLDLRRASQSLGPANVQYVLRNAYATSGKTLKKRPCLEKIATLEPGTAGLASAGGLLHTFYESGTVVHADPLFHANKVPHPTLSQLVAKVHFAELFNGYVYTAVEYVDGSCWHHYLDGTVPPRITDVNCPQSKIVKKINQKIYAKKGGDVAYCKTSAPRDWTTALDAGVLSTSLHASGSDDLTALGAYQGDLSVSYADGTQLWHVDPDPTLNALKSTSDNVGTRFPHASATLGSDQIFLAAVGWRSVSLTALTNNLQENDVGSPVDKLRPEIHDNDNPLSIYYPGLGQMWTINGTRAYVYSFGRSTKLSAWSVFDFPITISAAAVLSNQLYVRAGDNVYRIDQTRFNDDGIVPEVSIEMYFQDCKSSGINKQFIGFDTVVSGTPDIAFRFKSDEGAFITEFASLGGDTRPNDLFPMEITATSVAPVWRHQADEAFELTQLQLYYQLLSV
jgi:hypothetical protein